MSARAAVRLETLGFSKVYRYTPGKADWKASGLPTEGEQASVPRTGDVAKPDVPTCRLDEPVGQVRERIQTAGWDQCVVVHDGTIVLGRLRGDRLDVPPDTPAEEAMEPGPTTYRPDTDLVTTVKNMREANVETLLVTTGDGVLVGALYRQDAELRLHEAHEHHQHAAS